MEMLDNKAHILSEITKAAKREIAKLQKDHDEKVAALRTDLGSRTDARLKELADEHRRALARIERQHASTLDLIGTQRTLESESTLHTRVLAELRKNVDDGIVAAMVERLKAGGRELQEIRVPKGSKVPGTKAVLDEPKAVGIISENEELEVTLDDLLHEHHRTVHDIIADELFK